MDLKLSHVVNRAHPVIDFIPLFPELRAINCLVVNLLTAILFIQVGIIELLIQNSTEGLTRVELDPGRRQHEVDMALELVAPEFDNSAQVELADDVVGLDQRVHVGF